MVVRTGKDMRRAKSAERGGLEKQGPRSADSGDSGPKVELSSLREN